MLHPPQNDRMELQKLVTKNSQKFNVLREVLCTFMPGGLSTND
jgi:hypothetical protein